MRLEDCYFLGKITRKHGVKGQLILKLDTDEPNTYNNLESVLLLNEGKLIPFFIKSRAWNSKGNLMVTFEDITFEIADDLINLGAYLPLYSLPKLTGNNFYYHEVINFSIISDLGKNIGKIVSINDETAQNFFVLENEIQKQIIIPIIDEWIIEVNRENSTITMDLPLGIDEL